MSSKVIEKKRRILVIDDNPAIHDDFRKILVPSTKSRELVDAAEAFFGEPEEYGRDMEIELDTASQGEEGVELAKRAIEDGHPYAVAFVDMRMPPGWDGLTTIVELWKLDPLLQVVICSAYSDYSWTQIRNRLGESDRLLILKKPFDNAEVLQLTAALIEKRQLTEKSELRAQELEAIVAERTRHWRKARTQSELLISAIDSMLVELNACGEVNRWNASAEEIFGLKKEDVIGRRFEELPIPWESADQSKRIWGRNSRLTEVAFMDQAGLRRVLGVTSYVISDGRACKGTLILGSDLTEHRNLESQLQQAQKLEAVGQLAAGVAHEINTPMQYVGDNLDFLKKKVGSLQTIVDCIDEIALEECPDGPSSVRFNKLKNDIQKLRAKNLIDNLSEAILDSREGVDHVSKIVRAMKAFAHPGQQEKAPVDVNRALESTITVSTNEWKYVAEVETEFDPSQPTVQAMPVELNQVFLNILINAAHAVAESTNDGKDGKGTIKISTQAEDDSVLISISDTGIGMPEEVKKRMFDPFYTTKEVGKGTGQGLSIAHNVVVSQHGGQVWCDSTPDVGTTIYIKIPIEDGLDCSSADKKVLVSSP